MGKQFIQESGILSLLAGKARRSGSRDTVTRTATGFVYTVWNTDIAILDGSKLTLDSGGWHTKLTKDRINDTLNFLGLPIRLVQEKFGWFISGPAGKEKFVDGMTIDLGA